MKSQTKKDQQDWLLLHKNDIAPGKDEAGQLTRKRSGSAGVIKRANNGA